MLEKPIYDVTNTLFNKNVNYVIYDDTLYSDVVNIKNINHVTQSQPYYVSKNMSSHTMNLVTHDENHSSDTTAIDPVPLCVNYVTHGSHNSSDILTTKPVTQNEKKQKRDNAIIQSDIFPSNKNYVTHGDTYCFTNIITPFTNPVKYGENLKVVMLLLKMNILSWYKLWNT